MKIDPDIGLHAIDIGSDASGIAKRIDDGIFELQAGKLRMGDLAMRYIGKNGEAMLYRK